MKRQTLVLWTLAKVAIAVLVLGWCALHLRRFDPWLAVSLPAWTSVPGWVFLIAGSLLVLTCGGILSNRGILTSEDPLFPREFVAFGPFRYVRNPMSLGLTILMLGLGLYESSIAVLLFTLGLFLLLHIVVVYIEEPGLEKRFGESYRDYKCSVNRWLPNFRVLKS